MCVCVCVLANACLQLATYNNLLHLVVNSHCLSCSLQPLLCNSHCRVSTCHTNRHMYFNSMTPRDVVVTEHVHVRGLCGLLVSFRTSFPLVLNSAPLVWRPLLCSSVLGKECDFSQSSAICIDCCTGYLCPGCFAGASRTWVLCSLGEREGGVGWRGRHRCPLFLLSSLLWSPL